MGTPVHLLRQDKPYQLPPEVGLCVETDSIIVFLGEADVVT